MRTLSTLEEKLWASGHYVQCLKVEVYDGGGWRNVTDWEGYNWVESVSIEENVDQPVATAEVLLTRSRGPLLSLANLMADSKANTTTNDGNPILAPGREILVWTGMAIRGTVTPAVWHKVFHGYVDEVAWSESPIRLSCRDLGGKLQDTFIETELVYGFCPNYHRAPGYTSRHWLAREILRPSAGANGYCYQTEQGGSSNPSGPEPDPWSTTWGNSNGDFRCLGPLPSLYGAAVWTPSTAVAVDDMVAIPAVFSKEGYFLFRCTTAGTTGTICPSLSVLGVGSTGDDVMSFATDGSVTWKKANFIPADAGGGWVIYPEVLLEDLISQILLDHFGSASLTVPVASTWKLTPWRQERKPVLEAIRFLASQIGWDVRYWWTEASNDFTLTMQEPDRAASSPVRTFGPDEYSEVSRLDLSIADVRNAIQVVYSDRSDLSANGVDYVRKTASASDATSITKYGRRFAEIGESSASRIDSSTEAQDLADAVLADLKEPIANQEVRLRAHFYAVQLNDLLTLEANGVHYDSNQTVAVVGIRHSLSSAGNRTSLVCRGKPCGGVRQWLSKMTGPGLSGPPRLAAPTPPTDVSVNVATAGWAFISFVPSREGLLEAEVYVSTSSGFTPGTANLVQRGRTNAFSVKLTANTYYLKIIVRDEAGNASVASDEVPFTVV